MADRSGANSGVIVIGIILAAIIVVWGIYALRGGGGGDTSGTLDVNIDNPLDGGGDGGSGGGE